jgi:hypothetical protein
VQGQHATLLVRDDGVHRSYERLLLQQPHVEVRGLWQLGGSFYIECPGLADARTIDGHPLVSWFDGSCRVICSPVSLTQAHPTGATLVEDRSLEEIALLCGEARTTRDVFTDLALALPKDFPNFTVPHGNDGIVHLVFQHPLSAEQNVLLRSTYARLGMHPNVRVEVDPSTDPALAEFRHPPELRHIVPDVELLPSKRLPAGVSRDVRFLVEADEDFWSGNRVALFSEGPPTIAQVVPQGWRGDESRCLLNTARRPGNIRHALTLYDEVLLVMPTADRAEAVFGELRLPMGALPELARSGRLKFLLPEAIDRYPAAILAGIAAEAPESLLLSRRLATASIVELRRRVPFLFPPLRMSGRRQLLEALYLAGQKAPDVQTRSVVSEMALALGRAWMGAEVIVGRAGAAATPVLGMAPVIAASILAKTQRNPLEALIDSAASVEWAAPFGAHVFPLVEGGEREDTVTDLMASLYSGLAPGSTMLVPVTAHNVIDGMLSIDGDSDIVEFARTLGAADIRRFRELVHRTCRENLDPDFLQQRLTEFNREVRAYERHPDRWRSWNVLGLLGALVPVVVGAASGPAGPQALASLRSAVPLGLWMLQFMLALLGEDYVHKNKAVGTLLDSVNAVMARGSPDAVLVCRMRKHLKALG